MSIDIKTVNKILGKQIEQDITKIINNDQVEFTPGMQEWVNKCKLINVIYYINRIEDKDHTIISTDE